MNQECGCYVRNHFHEDEKPLNCISGVRIIIGNHLYKKKYVSELVSNLNDQLQLLSKIAETEPESAYAVFASGFKSKLTYFIHTVPDISELLLPLEYTIRQKLIPAITGGQICSNNESILLSLPTR